MFYFEPCLARKEDVRLIPPSPACSFPFAGTKRPPPSSSPAKQRQEAPVCLAAGLLDGGRFEYEPSRERLLTRPEGLDSLGEAMEHPFLPRKRRSRLCRCPARQRGLPPGPAHRHPDSGRSPHGKRGGYPAYRAAAGGRSYRRPGGTQSLRRGGSPTGVPYPSRPVLSAPHVPGMGRGRPGKPSGSPPYGPWDFRGRSLLLLEIHNAADASGRSRICACIVPCVWAAWQRAGSGLSGAGRLRNAFAGRDPGGGPGRPVRGPVGCTWRYPSCQSDGSREEEALDLLTAVAAHNGAQDLQRAAPPPADYRPLPILPIDRPEQEKKEPPLLTFPGGCFEADGRFTVGAPAPRLPWCHILANPSFGTLVSDASAGFTWAVSARENRLTPWDNDTASDNQGERLLLRLAGQSTAVDPIQGARASFRSRIRPVRRRVRPSATRVVLRVPEKATSSWRR